MDKATAWADHLVSHGYIYVVIEQGLFNIKKC